jgi:hypothetical protein
MAIVRTPPIRLGFRVADSIVERDIANRTLDERDYNVLLNPAGGPMMVYMPDGKPLCCYLPGALSEIMSEVDAYELLHPLHAMMTNNRGMASGTKRIERGDGGGTRSDSMNVSSPILGNFEPSGVYRYCRMTEWTGSHLPEWESLAPLFRVIASHFEERVTERFNAQMEWVRKTDESWLVPGTPFTTITVNNSYATGCHRDQGDLVEGFSTLACIRRGEYEGGILVFPQYRVGVNMQDGDLLLMDAHQWHGNTRMTCACGERIINKFCSFCGAERISIVSYYRTRMAECGSPEQELERAMENTEKRSQPRKVKEEPETEQTEVTEPEPEPARKPRARKQSEPESEPEVNAQVEAAPPEPVKRKPGRPRKNANATDSPGSRRGGTKIAVDPETGEPLME